MGKNNVTFGKFERPSAGDDCNGCEVFINGVLTLRAIIVREVSWKQSTMGAYYGMTVTGYEVRLSPLNAEGKYSDEDNETLYDTLVEARAAVKAFLAAQPIEHHIAECMTAWARGIRTRRTRWGTLVECAPGEDTIPRKYNW